MGEPAGGAVLLSGPAPTNTRRPANNRIKLNRDLMQRLASALGNQAAKWHQQQQQQQQRNEHEQTASNSVPLSQPLRARLAEPIESAAASEHEHNDEQQHELTNRSNNKSSPTWAPVNQNHRQHHGQQPRVRSLETCFAPTAKRTIRGRRRGRAAFAARPPVYLAESEGHEVLANGAAGACSSNCSRGKHCCGRGGGGDAARRKRCRQERASSFCYYANDNSAPNRASSSSNSAHANHNYSTAPNNAAGKQSDSDANNCSSAPTIARQLAGRRPAAGALFLLASPLGAHCLGQQRRQRRRRRRWQCSRLNGCSSRAHHVAGELAAAMVAPRRCRRAQRSQPAPLRAADSGWQRAWERQRREDDDHHHSHASDNHQKAVDEHERADRFYDPNHKRRKAASSSKQTVAARTRRSEIKPTTVIAAAAAAAKEQVVVARRNDAQTSTVERRPPTNETTNDELSAKSARTSQQSSSTATAAEATPARASGSTKQEEASAEEKRAASRKQRAQNKSQRQEVRRAPRLQHESGQPKFTQAGPRMAQQFMNCDIASQASQSSRRSTTTTTTTKSANQQVEELRPTRANVELSCGGKLKGTRVNLIRRRTPNSLLFWLLLGFLAPLLLLLLRPGAAPLRPLVEPASCLQLPNSLASSSTTTKKPNITGSVQQSTRSDNDEFSRAVMATMSTQSTLASNFTSSRLMMPSAQPLVSQSTGGGGGTDFDISSMSAGDRSPDDELTGAARTPATLNEFESSDDLILSDERSLVRAPFASDSTAAVEGGGGGGADSNSPPVSSSSDVGSRATTSMAQLHAELQQQQQKNGSSTSGAGNNSARPGELEDYFNKFVEFARIFAMVAIMIGDICGNSLVILSVVRHSKLRVTTNWFVVSLACADILVALFAMTFNASVQITGRWIFPRWMCDFWNSCDVLASTASILHLCCISIDRYYAIMRPLDYPMKITTRRVCYALAVVWISSALLSYIPIFTGIYTTSEFVKWQQENPDQCEFVVNRVYAIVSSSISFWIPCCIMVFTYYKIYQEATRQEKFIYKAQSMMPAPQANHHHRSSSNAAPNRSKQHRSKSMAITSLSSSSTSTANSNAKGRKANAAQIKQFAAKQQAEAAVASSSDALNVSGAATAIAGSNTNDSTAAAATEQQPLTGSAVDLNNNGAAAAAEAKKQVAIGKQAAPVVEDQDDRDSNSGQSTPTKRSISKMKREHKAAKTLGIIMGVFILCWLPFFSWYTPQHICGHACDGIIPHNVVTLLFWIGYFNSTLNPIIYAYFNHEFRDAFKKTLQWLFCCCRDLKCLRVNRPNDNQHYNCTYRSTQEIGLVTNG